MIRKYKTRQGMNFTLEEELYNKILTIDETGKAYDRFEYIIVSESFFPSFMQFITLLIALLFGKNDFWGIFLSIAVSGVIFSWLWIHTTLYKISILSTISIIWGQIVCKFFLPFLTIILLSILVFKDWKIVLFYVISKIITHFITSFLCGYKNTIKHNNNVAKYILKEYNA